MGPVARAGEAVIGHATDALARAPGSSTVELESRTGCPRPAGEREGIAAALEGRERHK